MFAALFVLAAISLCLFQATGTVLRGGGTVTGNTLFIWYLWVITDRNLLRHPFGVNERFYPTS